MGLIHILYLLVKVKQHQFATSQTNLATHIESHGFLKLKVGYSHHH